jgi:hypothetical protein
MREKGKKAAYRPRGQELVKESELSKVSHLILKNDIE